MNWGLLDGGDGWFGWNGLVELGWSECGVEVGLGGRQGELEDEVVQLVSRVELGGVGWGGVGGRVRLEAYGVWCLKSLPPLIARLGLILHTLIIIHAWSAERALLSGCVYHVAGVRQR